MLAERIFDKMVGLIDNLIWDAVPPYGYDPDCEARNPTKAVVDAFSNQATRLAVVDAIEGVMFLTHQQQPGMRVTVAPGWNPDWAGTIATTLTAVPWITAPPMEGNGQ
jgi:hypothetical protein